MALLDIHDKYWINPIILPLYSHLPIIPYRHYSCWLNQTFIDKCQTFTTENSHCCGLIPLYSQYIFLYLICIPPFTYHSPMVIYDCGLNQTFYRQLMKPNIYKRT